MGRDFSLDFASAMLALTLYSTWLLFFTTLLVYFC